MTIRSVTVTPAEALLHTFGVSSPVDIEVEAIAMGLGAFIRYDQLDGCAARIVGVGDRARIVVDPRCPTGRRRFSAAHELGHWHFDRGSLSVLACSSDVVGSECGSGVEQRANQFAADLLMPRYLFATELRRRDLTVPDAKSLAETFRVGLTAACLRVAKYAERPALLVRYNRDSGRRRSFKRTETVPSSFWPLEHANEETGAFELLFGGLAEHMTRPRVLRASRCVQARLADQFDVVESAFRTRGDVWSLVWWRNEGHVIELADD